MNITEAGNAFAIPLVVAVTGHRDLVPAELPTLRDKVAQLFRKLQNDYPDRRLQLMSALAEGADQLAAEVALELGVELVVTLPMPRHVYHNDFVSAESKLRFDALCERATDIYELPLARGNSAEGIATIGPQRTRQYAQLGVFLCAHCHVLLAIWDGKPTGEMGGTAHVVKFHHDDIMPGYTSPSAATQQTLVDDESDLVYHIVCSRERADGAPQEGLTCFEGIWFTKDRDKPRCHEMPQQHQTIFQRGSEFSRDAIKHAEAIAVEKYPLYSQEQEAEVPAGGKIGMAEAKIISSMMPVQNTGAEKPTRASTVMK